MSAWSVLTDDARLSIFGTLESTRTLNRAAATCRAWRVLLRRGEHLPAAHIWRNSWLTVPLRSEETGKVVLTVQHALSYAPPGERIMLAEDTKLRGELHCSRHLHLKAAAGVRLKGTLMLDGTAHPPRGSLLDCSPARGEIGVIEGLSFEHFDEESVILQGGSWRLDKCSIGSSRRGRASTALLVRNGAALGLLDCSVSDATHAVCLERWPCQVRAAGCTFANIQAAIYTRGGGLVDASGCTFGQGTDIAFKIDENVRGSAVRNHLGEGTSMFGQWARPPAFRCAHTTEGPERAAMESEGEGSEDNEGGASSPLAGARGGASSQWPQPPAGLPAISGPAHTWVQCDACNKWRKLPELTAMQLVADGTWTCSMNPDGLRNSCDSAEEPQPRDEVALWQAEALLGRKVSSGMASDGYPRGTELFLVKWAGYGAEHNSWEQAGSLPQSLRESYGTGGQPSTSSAPPEAEAAQVDDDDDDLGFAIEEFATAQELKQATAQVAEGIRPPLGSTSARAAPNRFLVQCDPWHPLAARRTGPTLSEAAKADQVKATRCEVCKSAGRERLMLLCDGCDRGFHTFCLSPPLNAVPDGDWLCKSCSKRAVGRDASSERAAHSLLQLSRSSPSSDSEDKQCEVCRRTDSEELMLLCDHCDRGFHTFCLPEPLDEVPQGEWSCKACDIMRNLRASGK